MIEMMLMGWALNLIWALPVALAVWTVAFFSGRSIARYHAKRVAEELRLMFFGDPKLDPRRR